MLVMTGVILRLFPLLGTRPLLWFVGELLVEVVDFADGVLKIAHVIYTVAVQLMIDLGTSEHF